jgi:lactoylglutathione lyase
MTTTDRQSTNAVTAKRRILHTMLRVGDMQASIDFYTRALGMSLIRQFDNPEKEYQLTFMGFGPEERNTVIELTYNYGVSHYEKGRAFGHIAIGVDDCAKACEQVRNCQGTVVREPGPLEGGEEFIAFVQDPDGNLIEFIQRSEDWFL